jgi:hypothetical protein
MMRIMIKKKMRMIIFHCQMKCDLMVRLFIKTAK